jgi:UDP-glucose 4-epimerase
MNILVTGGAGYIGSHAVRSLLAAGHRPVVLDNLSKGHAAAVAAGVPLVELDVRNSEGVYAVLRSYQIECVMHFAAFADVGASVKDPLTYYDNNTRGTLSLIGALERARVKRLVFSSTCATYGEPKVTPIAEDTPQIPVNPYGWSKLFSERMLLDYARKEPDFSFAALRYFNVAGCASDGSLGEQHDPETHLIPVILQAALGKRRQVTIFGEDYPTPDGTCIRDYVHVEDLVDAHLLVASSLQGGQQLLYNLGIGRGYSVREIVSAAQAVVPRPFRVETGARRAGDPPALFADASKIRRELGWAAKHTDIQGIIQSAWRWFEQNPDGYPAH